MNHELLINALMAHNRKDRERLDEANLRVILTRFHLSGRGAPTAGEAYTFFAQRKAQLATLDETLNTTIRQVAGAHDHALIHAFWTDERFAAFEKRPQELVRLALGVPVAKYSTSFADHPTDLLEHAFRQMGEEAFQAHKTLRNEWRQTLKAMLQEKSVPAQIAAVANAIKAAKLPKIDEDELLARGAHPDNAGKPYSGFLGFLREANGAIVQALETLELKEYVLYAHGVEEGIGAFAEAVQYLQAHPEAVIETAYERRVAGWTDSYHTKMASDDPEDQTFRVIKDGGIASLDSEGPLVQETLFRLVMDTLLIDPRRDADFVTRRTVGSQSTGYHFLYDCGGHVCIVGIPDREKKHASEVVVCKGDLETAKAALARQTLAVIGDGPDEVSFAEHNRLETEVDQAGPTAPRNPFKAAPFTFARIEEHFARRAAFAAALAER